VWIPPCASREVRGKNSCFELVGLFRLVSFPVGEEEKKVYAVDENVGGCLAEGRVKESEEGSQGLFLGEQNRESEGECGREGVGSSQRDRGRGAEEREQVSPSGEGGLIKFWIEVPSRATLSLAASYFRPA